MKPKNSPSASQQDLFRLQLSSMIDMRHELVLLAKSIDWQVLDATLGASIVSTVGNSALPTRLVAGLLYLQHAFSVSDEVLCARWLENPYWQYFCGEVYFQHKFPCHPTSLTKWRNRLGKAGCEALLAQTIKCAQSAGFLDDKQCQEVIVDTTVQEKNITFPTDTKLLEKLRQKLVQSAKDNRLILRQNYNRICKDLSWKVSGYGRAKQYKRMHHAVKKHKARVGRVYRDILRQLPGQSKQAQSQLQPLLAQAKQLLEQTRKSKNKRYSLHAPEVECIAKGKAHKRYEFGVKASFAISQDDNWVLGALHCPGNPYDHDHSSMNGQAGGHTLSAQVAQVERLTETPVTTCRVDKGYRGKDCKVKGVDVIHTGLSKKRMSRAMRKKLKRRSAIEPIIGHMKSDGKLGRCYLKGSLGDAMNIMLSAAGQNIRKLLNLLATLLRYFWLYYRYGNNGKLFAQ